MAIKKQAKVNVAKATPKAAKATPKAAKANKAKPARKSAAKKAKPLPAPVEAPPPKAEKSAKAYQPRKAASGLASYADLLKKQAELETIKKQAKAELRKAYEDKVKEAEDIKKQYAELFAESIGAQPKAAKARPAGAKPRAAKRGAAKRGAIAPYTAVEIGSFIEQKEEGVDLPKIKIAGRRIKSIKKIDEAYEKSEAKDVDSVLKLLRS
jgi:hypothetical protein